jgi:hypothetical protein
MAVRVWMFAELVFVGRDRRQLAFSGVGKIRAE